jgi:hypothetical protein
MNLADAPTLVADLLDEVCQSRETRSAVTLAVALVDRGRLTKIGDPVGLVCEVIAELSDAGLVTYRLRNDWAQIPLSIKATPQGYALAGYEHAVPAIGSRAAKRRGQALHLGPTEFQNHSETAIGGAIERMSLADHLDYYPEHRSIHPSVWEVGPYRSDPMAPKPINVQPVLDVLAVSPNRTATITQIHKTLNKPFGTVHRWLEEAVRTGRVSHAHGGPYVLLDDQPAIVTLSSREKILEILAEGPIATDKLLMNAMGGSWRTLGMHSLDHQLFSMEKAGLIEMDVKRNGSVQNLTNIRLPKKKAANINDPWPYAPAVESQIVIPVSQEIQDDAEQFSEAVQDVVEGRFPLLDSLRQREQASSETNRRVDALLAAASALDGVEQGESDRSGRLMDARRDGVSPVRRMEGRQQ